MHARRRLVAVGGAAILGVSMLGSSCRREVPHVRDDEEPPPVKLVEEPTPTGVPAYAPSVSTSAAPAASGVAPHAGRHAGDRVRVRWGGTCYASRIVRVNGPNSYLITYDGYSHSWDESVGESRICR